MKNSAIFPYGNEEDGIKNRNLDFSMDYDSGYVSRNHESNLDSSIENLNNLRDEPIYLSEDALLETPEFRKYPNTPVLSASTTHVSGSTGSARSLEISYSGFDSEESYVSVEIPCSRQIIIDKTYGDFNEMNPNKSLSGSAFSNITNTLVASEQAKKLNLIISKTEKENFFSVKRKYCSLTPPSEKNIGKNCSLTFVKKLSPPQIEDYSFMGKKKSECDSEDLSECPDEQCSRCVNFNEVITEEESSFNESCEVDLDVKNKQELKSASTNEVVLQDNVEEQKCDHLKEVNDILISEDVALQDKEEIPALSLECSHVNIISSTIQSEVSETLQDMLNNIEILLEKDRIKEKPKETESEPVKKTSEPLSLILSSISTPKKSQIVCNSFGLSPDLFEADKEEEQENAGVILISKADYRENIVNKDRLVLRRTQNNLKGVIPPRSVTVSKISVSEMLKKIENNKGYFWSCTEGKSNFQEKGSNSLLITNSVDTCKDKEFDYVLKERCLGLYHNRNKLSEEFESLCVKYGARYVGAETQSSCTVFEINTASPTKRRNFKPQWNAKSPGKRLSHLARRRITFSSSNIQSGSSWVGSRARQILVDAKKSDPFNRGIVLRKSPRKTPKKTPKKSPRIKTRTPSSSAKKKLALRFRKVTGEIEKSAESSSLSAKRTLFSSPDEDKKSQFLPSTSGASLTESDSKRNSSKRALFISPSKRMRSSESISFKSSPVKKLDFGKEKKRKRSEDDSFEEIASKFARCQSDSNLSTKSDVNILAARARSALSFSQTRQIKELTANNKKKLQLAVYDALRTQNVLPTHPQFKTFASNLGRLTRQLFLTTTGSSSVGATEKMFRIARLHVISVVKGKPLDKIYQDFTKQQLLKSQKPHGYVAPDEPHSSTESKNKIERIRKAINFGDDENS